MPLKNIPHGLIADGISQVLQGARDAVIAPGAILLGHAHHQVLQLLVYAGSSWRGPVLRAIKLLRHELTMPGQNRVGLHDGGNLLQRLLAQLLADLCEGFALAVGQVDPSLDLLTQDAVLRRQVFVAEQEGLVD